jgi:hypothetical protein
MPVLPMEVHRTVKEHVLADCASQRVSINHLVTRIVAKSLGVAFEQTGRASNGSGELGDGEFLPMPIPFPARIYDRIQTESERRQRERRRQATAGRPPYPKSEVVERILCEHYGLDYVARPIGRRPRVPA